MRSRAAPAQIEVTAARWRRGSKRPRFSAVLQQDSRRRTLVMILALAREHVSVHARPASASVVTAEV